MIRSILEWPVRKQLECETSILNRARIKVLSYALNLKICTTTLLLIFYQLENHQLQVTRAAVLLAIIVVYYIALSMGFPWRKAAHAAMLIFMLIIWSNLYIFQKGFDLVTLQYILVVSAAAFYGLGNRWGVIYSTLAVTPFLADVLMGLHITGNIAWGPQGSGRTTIVIQLLQNFILMVLINYFFFSSFYETIDDLDARRDELRASLESLEDSQRKLQTEYVHQKHLIASISHDIKSPLRFLMTTTGRLARIHPDLSMVRAISQSSYRLYHFMKNLLEYTEFRYKNSAVQFTYLDLNEMVEQKFAIFVQDAEVNANRFVNGVVPGVIIKNNQQLVGIILHNLIDNANKATNGGTVSVTYEDFREELHLIVNDTGPGMESTVRDWINSASKQLPEDESTSQNFGMGLLIVKEISTLIRARLLAKPNQPVGTSVHIIFSK
ncbi:MAG: two-component sensor histidine kinase [Dyadobacter sp. 50-39]|uniref:sensor histidine kinase n=1 Tax=Dyadobacter sp. 50-39 TaxID=1895756 RepID=UPI00096028FA|nr:HAMP domain-containing sensor histidine kinase [Dyadobacter sp. 50-39]OJV18086.1 MAG: two-component sensor histidine kinase [Dyadobacter sp. 50-39]